MGIQFQFNEAKAIQAAAFLLEKTGCVMNYMTLLKLLYLADRKSLLTTGSPITGAQPYSMKFGPVLSEIDDRVAQRKQDRSFPNWHRFIPRPAEKQFTVSLVDGPGEGLLSVNDKNILNEIFDQFGHLNQMQLSELTHQLPEWNDPGNTSVPIFIESILAHERVSKEDFDAIAEAADLERALASL